MNAWLTPTFKILSPEKIAGSKILVNYLEFFKAFSEEVKFSIVVICSIT